jgi:hypothetical protein
MKLIAKLCLFGFIIILNSCEKFEQRRIEKDSLKNLNGHWELVNPINSMLSDSIKSIEIQFDCNEINPTVPCKSLVVLNEVNAFTVRYKISFRGDNKAVLDFEELDLLNNYLNPLFEDWILLNINKLDMDIEVSSDVGHVIFNRK